MTDRRYLAHHRKAGAHTEGPLLHGADRGFRWLVRRGRRALPRPGLACIHCFLRVALPRNSRCPASHGALSAAGVVQVRWPRGRRARREFLSFLSHFSDSRVAPNLERSVSMTAFSVVRGLAVLAAPFPLAALEARCWCRLLCFWSPRSLLFAAFDDDLPERVFAALPGRASCLVLATASSGELGAWLCR